MLIGETVNIAVNYEFSQGSGPYGNQWKQVIVEAFVTGGVIVRRESREFHRFVFIPFDRIKFIETVEPLEGDN